MPLRNLEDCFHDELKDVLSAEKQLTRSLPKLVAAAEAEALVTALEEHLAETEQQVARLEQVFELVDFAPRSKKCKAMQGLLEETADVLEEEADPTVLDAMIIAAAQKVEHYEIATYGTLCAWARLLGHNEAAGLLDQTLQEEKAADEKLTVIALELVNREAAVNV
jgi:ferritin-like metal-binding protein YciE